jgi:phospholipase/carboxylesterase
MKTSIESRQIGEWVVTQQTPTGKGPHPVLLLLHGWTGDETVMWVFTRRMSQRYLMISPRGIFKTPTGGYGWQSQIQQGASTSSDLRISIDRLIQLLTPNSFPIGDFSDLSAIGFSQGAALMFTMALIYPQRIKTMAGLAGFLPDDATDLIINKPLTNKRIFIAHGRLDDKVPVDKARKAVDILSQAGAQVSYCEEDVGHKLSASCFRSMESFFNLIEETRFDIR